MSRDKALFYVVGAQMIESLLRPDTSNAASTHAYSQESSLRAKEVRAEIVDLGPTFSEISEKLVAQESQRVLRGEFSAGSVGIIKNRLKVNILPVLGHIPVSRLDVDDLQSLLVRLSDQESSTTTISQYMVIVRKVLKLALARKLISEIPEIPKVRITSKPRSTFTATQYLQLLRAAKRLARQGDEVPCIKQGDGLRERFWVTQKYRVMSPDMYWLIGFMANSFVRPSDIRTIKLEPVLKFQMKGLGYGHPEWAQGMWKGELAVAGESFDPMTLDPLAPENIHVQQVVRATDGQRTGVGVLEQVCLGPYAPSGFKSLLDGAA